MLSKPRPITIVLIGSSGGGKSSTGNTLVRSYIFKTSDSLKSCTFKCDHAYSEELNMIVIDTPGFSCTNQSESDIQQILTAMARTILEGSTDKIDAFVLVEGYFDRLNTLVGDIEKTIDIFGPKAMASTTILFINKNDVAVKYEDFYSNLKSMANVQKLISTSSGGTVDYEKMVIWNNKVPYANQISKLKSAISRCKPYTMDDIYGMMSNVDARIAPQVQAEISKLKIEQSMQLSAEKNKMRLNLIIQKHEKAIGELTVVQTKINDNIAIGGTLLANLENSKVTAISVLKDKLQHDKTTILNELNIKEAAALSTLRTNFTLAIEQHKAEIHKKLSASLAEILKTPNIDTTAMNKQYTQNCAEINAISSNPDTIPEYNERVTKIKNAFSSDRSNIENQCKARINEIDTTVNAEYIKSKNDIQEKLLKNKEVLPQIMNEIEERKQIVQVLNLSKNVADLFITKKDIPPLNLGTSCSKCKISLASREHFICYECGIAFCWACGWKEKSHDHFMYYVSMPGVCDIKSTRFLLIKTVKPAKCVAVHKNVECDCCGEKEFSGVRWKCANCPNFDVCGKCFDKIHRNKDSACIEKVKGKDHDAQKHVYIKIDYQDQFTYPEMIVSILNEISKLKIEDLTISDK